MPQGVHYLVENGLLEWEAESVAEFLYKEEGLNKTAIGNFLGERYSIAHTQLIGFIFKERVQVRGKSRLKYNVRTKLYALHKAAIYILKVAVCHKIHWYKRVLIRLQKISTMHAYIHISCCVFNSSCFKGNSFYISGNELLRFSFFQPSVSEGTD